VRVPKTAVLPLLLPVLSFSSPVVGTVSLLDGTPLAGASVRVGSDTTRTGSDGSFSIERSSGIVRNSRSAPIRGTTLRVEEGRLDLRFDGSDGLGRSTRGSATPPAAAPRIQAASEQLTVYWNGKRLVLLPLPSDTGSLVLRIDTAWWDDAGVPWNPRASYGSLRDARDGRSYRTVRIGSQNWMAENLVWIEPGGYTGVCWGAAYDQYRTFLPTCRTYGRLYSRKAALAADSADTRNGIPGTAHGICPSGWHIPTDTEWVVLLTWVDTQTAVPSPSPYAALKSIDGWSLPSEEGADLFGFRALPGGYYASMDITTSWIGRTVGAFLTGSGPEHDPWARQFTRNWGDIQPHVRSDRDDWLSLRCLQD